MAGRPAAITRLADAPTQGKKNWLIYAASGEGKTVLAGTAPKALFLTVEAAGTESAKLFGSSADEWVMDTKKDLDAAYDFFKRGPGCEEYEWVLHDSLTEQEDLYWYYVQGDRNSKKIQEYPEIETMIKKWVDQWNRLPVNVLYTATTMIIDVPGETEDDEERPMLVPSIGTSKGKAALSIAAKASLVGYMRTHTRKNEETDDLEQLRILHLRSDGGYIAKDRHGIAPKTGMVKNPNIERMYAKAMAASAKGLTIAPDTSSQDAASESKEGDAEENPRRRRRTGTDN